MSGSNDTRPVRNPVPVIPKGSVLEQMEKEYLRGTGLPRLT